MKTILCVFFFIGTTAAFGQVGGSLSAEPVVLTLPSHPHVAAYTALSVEKNLSEKSAFTFGTGERPLWEFAPVHHEVPLGDVARALREEHLRSRKAEFVREN